MYTIKQQPEDFEVKELIDLDLKNNGEYSYFVLKKKNYNSLDAVQKIASALKIPVKSFGFAGTKDKKAVTEQVCSAKNVSKEALEKIHLKDIELQFVGRGYKPISLGIHFGNHFKIIVRNIDKLPAIKTKFINYFGEQRLSTNNANIGKLIVQKKFNAAVHQLCNEPSAKEHLQCNPTDAVGALKKVQFKILKFYVHAYQSFLWNRMAEQNQTEKFLPIIGFATRETDAVKKILADEQISTRDFIIKQLPDLSSEGGERIVWAEAKDLKVNNLEDDDLNIGMKKVLLEFTLDKGCYATEFIKQSFG